MFIESRFTSDTQNILHLNQGTIGHISLTVTPFPKVRSGVHGNGVTGINYALLETNYFQLELNTLGFLTLRLLMSYVYIYIYIYIYIYMEHLFLMFLDHTQRRSTVGRTPLDE